MSTAPAPLKPHLSTEQIKERFERCRQGVEKLRWLALLKRAQGQGTQATAAAVCRRPDWVRRVVRRYNSIGPDGLVDGRRRCGRRALLDAAQLNELREAVESGTPPSGGLWTGPKVAQWISNKVGRKVPAKRGWVYMKRLKMRLKVPRIRHPSSSPESQQRFQKKGPPRGRPKGS